MKTLRVIVGMFLLALLLVGCGQEKTLSPPVDISMTEIVWQGFANTDPVLLQKFDDVMACLLSLNVSRQGYPYVVIVQDNFTCTPYTDRAGCFEPATDIIYFAQNFYAGFFSHDIFKHEVIHWATKRVNEAHGTIYFTQCDPSYHF